MDKKEAGPADCAGTPWSVSVSSSWVFWSSFLLADRSAPTAIRYAVASRDRAKLLGAAAQWRVLWVK